MITLLNYLRGESGATAIEYALLASGIALAISVAVLAFGSDLSNLYDGLSGIFAGG